ncbi:hypothetical protein JHK87_023949 [Glycine soja]|nr:hypothetical protein JHK87_023949 [Glycine soja]
MSEEAKKNFAGALTARPNSDEPKPAPVPAVPPKKVIIKSADMIPDMQKEAVDIAVAAFEKYNVEKDVAEQIKKEFDKRHGPTWHCIVGRNFGPLSIGSKLVKTDVKLVQRTHLNWSPFKRAQRKENSIVGVS